MRRFANCELYIRKRFKPIGEEQSGLLSFVAVHSQVVSLNAVKAWPKEEKHGAG